MGEGRVAALDAVRGVAILLVVLDHALLTRVKFSGAVGVMIFFVLSGYLITRVLTTELDREGRVDFARFYRRRAARLMPALGLALAATPLLMWLARDPALGRVVPTITFVGTYVANYAIVGGADLGAWSHAWSLAVEEHFYLVWPMTVVLLVRRTTSRAAVVVVSLLTVGFLCWRVYADLYLSVSRALLSSDTNAFALLLGAALALNERGRVAARRSRPIVLTASLVLLATLSVYPASADAYTDMRMNLWLSTAAVLGAWGLVAAARHSDLSPRLGWLAWAGRLSYGWYLWHHVLLLIEVQGRDPGPLQSLVAVPGSLLLAWLSYTYVERPLQRRVRSRPSPQSGGARIGRRTAPLLAGRAADARSPADGVA